MANATIDLNRATDSKKLELIAQIVSLPPDQTVGSGTPSSPASPPEGDDDTSAPTPTTPDTRVDDLVSTVRAINSNLPRDMDGALVPVAARHSVEVLRGRVDALERRSMRPFQNIGWAVMAFLAFSIVGCIAGWMVTDRTAGIVIGTMTGAIAALVIGFGLESRAQERAETDNNEA